MAINRRALLTMSAAGLVFTSDRLSAATTTPTVLITGADEHLGLRFVRDYAARHWNVIAGAPRPDAAAELQTLASLHTAIRVEKLDVTDVAAIQSLAEKYTGLPIDMIIHAAGSSHNSENLSEPKFGSDDHRAPDDYLRLHAAGPLKVTEAFYRNVVLGTHKQIVAITTTQGGYWRQLSDAALQSGMAEVASQAKKDGVQVVLLKA